MNNIKRCIAAENESFFLLGPRGTGKSTWLKTAFPNAAVIDLLLPETHRRLQANPGNLAEMVKGNAGTDCFVVDEVQKVPELLSVVHSLIEKHLGIRFVLTGSSARKLKRTGADLLSGRALKKTMHPFMASELGDGFLLDDALRFGMLPVIHGKSRKVKALETYVDLYLREEIAQEGLVRTLAPFARFLEAVSFSHGSQLVASAVARDCGVGRTTVDGYLKILYDLMIASTLDVFSKRAKRELAATPKFYFFDAGVYRTLRPKGPLDNPSEIDGMALEGLVWQHLRAWLDYSDGQNGLYYWRTASGREVDFVVYGETDFLAVEVKNASRLSPKDFGGLRALAEDYPQARLVLLYRGGEQYLTSDGILVVPVERYLKELRPNESSPDAKWRRS